MEMINTAAAAAQGNYERPNTVNHLMQKHRQAYLARLKNQTENKINSLRQEADTGVEGEETLQ